MQMRDFRSIPTDVPTETVTPKTGFSPVKGVYAWLCMLFGYLFLRATPVSENPLGGFLLILGLFITATVVMKLQQVKIPLSAIFSALSAVVLGGALILNGDGFPASLGFLYALFTWGYYLYTAHGNRLQTGFSDFVLADYCKALILPFYSLRALVDAISGKQGRKVKGLLLKCLGGVLLAAVPTAVILGFLSYDKGFTDILDKLFNNKIDFGSHLRSLLFAFPLAVYGFGLYHSAESKKLSDRFTAEGCSEVSAKVKILPQSTILIAVLPILFLYVVFFISQWQYYVSGFTGVLPPNFSYAKYAREGFFQLCAVSVINLGIILGILCFMHRNNSKKPLILKLITLVFCLFTLVLISTALAKLFLYIDIYGLTRKRVYAAWLMVLIGVLFLIIALGQFLPRIRPVALCFTVSVILFGALALSNVNGIIAGYNAQRYLDGTLDTVDVAAMEELGDAAIPAIARLREYEKAERPNGVLLPQLEKALEKRAGQFRKEDSSLFSFTLPRYRAEKTLIACGFDVTPEKPQ